MPGPSLKMFKPQHCSLKGKEILNINTVPLINTCYITLQNNLLNLHKLGSEVCSLCIFQVQCCILKKKKREKEGNRTNTKQLVEDSAKGENCSLNLSQIPNFIVIIAGDSSLKSESLNFSHMISNMISVCFSHIKWG